MNDKMTFGYLCEEALLSDYEGLIASERSGKCTKDHYKKLGHILGFRVYGKIPTARRVVAAILAAILICLGGCMAFGGRESGEPQFIRAEHSAVYGDYIFYCSNTNVNSGLHYQKLSAVSEKGFPMDGYTLQDTSDSSFTGVSWAYFAIDLEATERNGGIPVVIIGGSFRSQEDKGRREMFYSYNAKDASIELVAKLDAENMINVYLYGDTILFENEQYDLGRQICIIGKDGKGEKMLANPNKARRTILTVKDYTLYYQEGDKVYSVPVDLSEEPTLFYEGKYSTTAFFFHGDYLYQNIYTSLDYTLVRSPIADPTKIETVLSSINGMLGVTGEFIYHPMAMIGEYYGVDWNTTYLFDPETGESELLFQNTDPAFYTTREVFTEDYLVYSIAEYNKEEDLGRYLVVNRDTGEVIIIPS